MSMTAEFAPAAVELGGVEALRLQYETSALAGSVATQAAVAAGEQLGIDPNGSVAELEQAFAENAPGPEFPNAERVCYQWSDLAGNSEHTYEEYDDPKPDPDND
jgi:hypothetical protein